MTLRRLARVGAAMALAAGSVTGTFGLGASAQASVHAAPAQCSKPLSLIHYYQYSTPPYVVAEHFEECSLAQSVRPYFLVGLPVTIYKLESGTWVSVATGEEIAEYYCNGTTTNEYKDQSGDEVSAPCV